MHVGLPASGFFCPSNMDVYTNTGAFPPAAGNKRTSMASILIAGAFEDGTQARIQNGFGYTHVVLCDAMMEIRDPYDSNTGTLRTNQDYLAIPAAQTDNWWKVVFSFVAMVPNLGKRRVILVDRHGTPGSWSTVM